MKKVVKVFAVALLAMVANTLEARSLKIINQAELSTVDVKQINLKGKDLFGKITQATEMGLGSIGGAYKQGSKPFLKEVTNEPFTLQLKYHKSSFAGPEQIFNLDIQSGTQDGNKDIVIDVDYQKGAKRVQ